MADELRIVLDPFLATGLTLLGKVYGSDGLQEGSNVSMTEDSTGIYTGDFSLAAVSDGAYMVIFVTTSVFYGEGTLYVRDNAEVSQEQFEKKSEADTRQSALIVEHDATQADIAALNDFNPAVDVVARVTLTDTTTTNTDMRGTDNAALASTLAASDVQIAAIKERTDNLPDLPASKFDAIVGANA